MTQETANKLLKACSELIEMVDYAHPKFNWGTSHLDAKAIFLLSNAPVLARRAIIQAEQEQINKESEIAQ